MTTIVKEVVQTYACVGLWISLSAAVILHNKWLLTQQDFRFPVTLTMLHMSFSSSLAFVVCRVLRWVDLPDVPARNIFMSVAPIAALFAGVLVCGNTAYLFLSVPLIQMFKASMPILVLVTGVAFEITEFDYRLLAPTLVIAVGLIVVAHGHVSLSVVGVLLQGSSLIFEAVRLVLVEILPKRKNVHLNPLTTLYYMAPVTFLFLTAPFLLWEFSHLNAIGNALAAAPLSFLANCLLAFLLNLSVFLLIGKASALTMNVGGVAKDCLLIWLSSLIFYTRVRPKALFGFAIAVGGVASYNYVKWLTRKEAAEKARPPADADSEGV